MPDLILLHPPAFYDFRNRDDILFPYLSTSGDVPITPLYEYFPLGFKSLERYLEDRGHSVQIVNLASTLLKHPELSLERLLDSMQPLLFGIDLHWMVHVQGSLAVAQLLKSVHPQIPIIFGGISSTYYAEELIRYPFIDMVMQGYETHEPMVLLMGQLKGGRNLEAVPNLYWKDRDGQARTNGFDFKPSRFSCGIDWSVHPAASGSADSRSILEILSTQNAGCSFNCNWCGGSREAFRRVMQRHPTVARKLEADTAFELDSVKRRSNASRYHFYAVGSYNEPPQRMHRFVRLIGEANVRSVSYEQFHLTPEPLLREMARANRRTTITLSPESHELRISKLAGRGVYTNEELEAWIERALDIGISQIDIWYFIGMREQTRESVLETVRYCDHLLRKFAGKRVNPMICPMIPFLDPASTFFEYPARYGYKVFYRSVEEHRRGMENASLIRRINYSTQWLSRTDLVVTGYEAVRRLVEHKGEHGALPSGVAAIVARKIADSLDFLLEVDGIDQIADPTARASALRAVGGEIRRRNAEIFNGTVSNQAFPIDRQIGGRWFDEIPDVEGLA